MTRRENIILAVIDFILVLSSYYIAVVIRFEGEPSSKYLVHFEWLFLTNAAIAVVCYSYFGLYGKLWRYAGTQDLKNIFFANISAYSPAFLVSVLTGGTFYSRSIIFISGLLTLCATGGIRLLLRVSSERERIGLSGKRCLIVGANDAGETALRDILRSSNSNYRPLGFIDEDPKKLGMKIRDIPVLGTIENLPEIVSQHDIEEIIIALPSPALINQVIKECESIKVSFKVIPHLSRILDGHLTVNSIRNVEIEDLLERKAINLNMESIRSFLQGKSVLVTGAGGSIGSELCRQLAEFDVGKLILLGRGENSIHDIALELREKTAEPPIRFIGDIRDTDRMETLMKKYRPRIIFHAAAHKHVYLMESNGIEALTNNLFGTRNLIELSEKYEVEDFIMISTDKAVNPTSLMGSTKFLAEMYMNYFCTQPHHCRFNAVRFANVLDSRGSVIPIFRKQIAMGGPVTVTHEEMTRYFMTIPEAVQLVLQAAAMGKDGETYILDIGRPLKIIDLAKNMIRLSGFEPEVDIPIRITGISPGEKLGEELVSTGETTSSTEIEQIIRVHTCPVSKEEMENCLFKLTELVKTGDDSLVREELEKIIPSCPPTPPSS